MVCGSLEGFFGVGRGDLFEVEGAVEDYQEIGSLDG